jgi:transposase
VIPNWTAAFTSLLTTTGIAETSALQILGELAVLPDMLDARQWVAFSGLDPRLFKSGKSVEKRPRISRGGSRHLRRALYMPALAHCVVIPIYEASIKLTGSRQSSAASGRCRHAKTAACSVCHVPQQSTVRPIQAVRSGPGWQARRCSRLTDQKKRDGSPHLS